MDYGRLKELAEAFVGRGCVDYSNELDALVRDTATTGTVRLEWRLFCPLLHHRLEKEINSAFLSENDLLEEEKEMRRQLLKQLDTFENPPFTVQRLCELILQPRKQYKRLDCFLRAVEKSLLVVSTQEPDLEWMKGSSELEEKTKESEIKENGTTDILPEKPHSPLPAPPPPPVNNDSPPTAPTSTWSNMQEEGGGRGGGGEEGGEKKSDDGGGGGGAEGVRTHSPPLPPSRKRSRESLDQDEEDKSSITVRQEADSTVNFDPPSFEAPPTLYQLVDESPSKRSRECESEVERRRKEEKGIDQEMEENGGESSLSSSLVSELMETVPSNTETTVTGRDEEGNVEEKDIQTAEQISNLNEPTLDRSKITHKEEEEEVPDNQETKQVSMSESQEAMITN